ncbi:MAG: hypothetical protein ABI383_06940, partial [Acidobacteriaceae bacterium]
MRRVPVSAARVSLTVFFAGLLLTPMLVRKFSSEHSASASTRFDTNAALARYGFYLTNVSRAAGIDFVHQGPTLDGKLAAIMPEVA